MLYIFRCIQCIFHPSSAHTSTLNIPYIGKPSLLKYFTYQFFTLVFLLLETLVKFKHGRNLSLLHFFVGMGTNEHFLTAKNSQCINICTVLCSFNPIQGLIYRGVGGHLPPLGELLPPLDFLKVNTLYALLPPPTFWKLSVCPPSHIFCMQHCHPYTISLCSLYSLSDL